MAVVGRQEQVARRSHAHKAPGRGSEDTRGEVGSWRARRVAGVARRVVEALAHDVAGWPEVADRHLDDPDDDGFPASDLAHHDLDYADEAEQRLRDALAGHELLAYHASRLLPHEADWIRTEGLRTASTGLVDRRLRGAAEHYPEMLTEDEMELLRRSGPLAWQRGAVRLGLLWVVAPHAIFEEERGFDRLLGLWGGETIAWTNNEAAAAVVERFTRESLPSIVQVAVALEEVPEFERLWPTAVGRFLGLPRASTEWGLRVSLGPERVVGLLHPEHPRWPSSYR
jgi:hypothetical protein